MLRSREMALAGFEYKKADSGLSSLKTKTERKYPKEYRKAHQRYPSPEN